QRHVSAHMAGSDAVLRRGAAVPRQNCPWRPVLDRNTVWRSLACTTYAVAVAAGALGEIFLNPGPQCFCAAGEVRPPLRRLKPQSNSCHDAVVDLVREQGDRTQRDDVAFLGLPPD